MAELFRETLENKLSRITTELKIAILTPEGSDVLIKPLKEAAKLVEGSASNIEKMQSSIDFYRAVIESLQKLILEIPKIQSLLALAESNINGSLQVKGNKSKIIDVVENKLELAILKNATDGVAVLFEPLGMALKLINDRPRYHKISSLFRHI